MMKAIELAIERLRRLYAGVESYHEVYGCPPTGLGHQQRDERLVLDYVIAEHPADDAEPVTEEWLRSVGAVDDPAAAGSVPLEMHLDFTIGGRTHQMRFARDVFTERIGSWSLLPSVGAGRIWPQGREITRGRVRRLCAALGIELKSQVQLSER